MTHNLAQCQTTVRKAVSAGAKALFLPEASDYLTDNARSALSLCQPATTSPFVQGLQSLAREYSLSISVGIHEPTEPHSDRLRNTVIWIGPTGEIVHRYQKLHVFDIDLRSSGGPFIQESASTEPGSNVTPPFDTSSILSLSSEQQQQQQQQASLGHVGSLICFDVRFPEPALALRRQGANVLLYPSAFTVPTGKLHWEVLLRARAIENQCFVVAAAQCGRHNDRRVSYGGSMVVGPRGEVLGRLGHVDDEEAEQERTRDPEILVVDVNLDEVDETRRGLPLKRRVDVYSQV